MTAVFIVEDDFHAERMGEFSTRDAAIAFLERLKVDASAPENRPPCTNWRACHRDYYLLEYDDGAMPWTRVSSAPMFEVGQCRIRPITTRTHEDSLTGPSHWPPVPPAVAAPAGRPRPKPGGLPGTRGSSE
jgi:hypothetical protein